MTHISKFCQTLLYGNHFISDQYSLRASIYFFPEFISTNRIFHNFVFLFFLSLFSAFYHLRSSLLSSLLVNYNTGKLPDFLCLMSSNWLPSSGERVDCITWGTVSGNASGDALFIPRANGQLNCVSRNKRRWRMQGTPAKRMLNVWEEWRCKLY